jgi:hypothetical protein
MHMELFGLPANTEFTTFLLQVSNKPFGLVWYQGDIVTNRLGHGVGDFSEMRVARTRRPRSTAITRLAFRS